MGWGERREKKVKEIGIINDNGFHPSVVVVVAAALLFLLRSKLTKLPDQRRPGKVPAGPPRTYIHGRVATSAATRHFAGPRAPTPPPPHHVFIRLPVLFRKTFALPY